MEAKLDQYGEVVVVTINGRLDIDKTKPFQEHCIKNFQNKKVVFNLQPLNFVGSTGIQNFFQALKEINSKNKYGLRIAGMTVDFQRLWTISQDVEMIVYENTQVAVKSFEPQPALAANPTTEAQTPEASVISSNTTAA